MNIKVVLSIRPIEESEAVLPEVDNGWWEMKIEFLRLGVPIIRGIIGYAVDTTPNVLTAITYASVISTGEWLKAAFDTEYLQSSASVLTAAKDMGIKFLTNDQYQEAQEFWMKQTAKLQIAEVWNTIEQVVLPPISEDRYSAFTDAVEYLDFDTPIEGE